MIEETKEEFDLKVGGEVNRFADWIIERDVAAAIISNVSLPPGVDQEVASTLYAPAAKERGMYVFTAGARTMSAKGERLGHYVILSRKPKLSYGEMDAVFADSGMTLLPFTQPL